MNLRRLFSHFLLGKRGRNPGTLFLLAGLFNLLFLPFIHFHPSETHAHMGYELEHQHAGHFHSPELESLASLVHSHAEGEDPEAHPAGHTHSSPEEESGKVLFPFVAPGGKIKAFTLTQIDLGLFSTEPALRFSGKPASLHQQFFHPCLYLDRVPPVRGPPSL